MFAGGAGGSELRAISLWDHVVNAVGARDCALCARGSGQRTVFAMDAGSDALSAVSAGRCAPFVGQS